MNELLNHRARWASLQQLGIWLVLVTPVAAMAGSASAGFLWALDAVTRLRFDFPWLLFLLPLAGPVIVWLYQTWGGKSERGTNLLIDEIHQPGGGVPVRMAPLVLITTLITHLFGGSAGREGTAVQMGGGLASGFVRWFRVPERHRRMLLMAGVAAGFGSVFGTPLAGAVFAMEVLAIGSMRYDALIPCLVAALGGDLVCSAWGIKHTVYHIAIAEPSARFGFGHLDLLLVLKAMGAGAVFGLCSLLFSDLTHTLQNQFQRHVSHPWLRPMIGGALVIALTYTIQDRSYLGLGVKSPVPGEVTILSCFTAGGATSFSWLWKTLFTAITLGSGFKGGEVTPLFYIGAAMGNLLSRIMDAPVDLFAGLGFVAVFSGASNTPLACTLMGIELFGAEHGVYLGVACFTAYLFSGHSGIYGSQRIAITKGEADPLAADMTLNELRHRKHQDSGSPTEPPPPKS
ncbi:MAG TPA: voltage-gated chloride channel family protein [Candidatus Limnocylindria bacterium]|jgi:H+/Cl- antiporter ClcA|nr:voltage-gated chloride channel family protein [Candidatus Limnocylindria bacterium]